MKRKTKLHFCKRSTNFEVTFKTIFYKSVHKSDVSAQHFVQVLRLVEGGAELSLVVLVHNYGGI